MLKHVKRCRRYRLPRSYWHVCHKTPVVLLRSEVAGSLKTACIGFRVLAFREDEARMRLGHADENLAVLRHISLNLLRQEKSSRMGIHAKRLKAGWDNSYLQRVLDGVN